MKKENFSNNVKNCGGFNVYPICLGFMAALLLVCGGLELLGIVPTNTLPIMAMCFIPVTIWFVFYYIKDKKEMEVYAKKVQLAKASTKTRILFEKLEEQQIMEGFDDLVKNKVNVKNALTLLENDIESYDREAKNFIDKSHIWEKELEKLLKTDSMEEYSMKASNIKNKAKMLGFRNLSDTAFFHEFEAKLGEVKIVRDNWIKFSLEIKEASMLLQSYFASEAYFKKRKTMDWNNKLKQALICLEEMDMEGSKILLNELLESSTNPHTIPILKNILTGINEIEA